MKSTCEGRKSSVRVLSKVEGVREPRRVSREYLRSSLC